jgi:dephospho-CoA kinase
MTKIIGLTGGIGSGKTTIAKLFEAEGIPVYIADMEAKKLMLLPETITAVVSAFGTSVLKENQIDTKLLSAVVFNNPDKLKVLNSIMHPMVKKHFDNWVREHSNSDFVVKEAAILFESGSYKYCDKIITVVASIETRIQRVVKRDNTTEALVMARINNQLTDADRISRSDYIIENENLEEAKIQFDSILKKLKNLH